MKLIHQIVGLILGFIIGLLTSFSIVAGFLIWFLADTKKNPSSYKKMPKTEDTLDKLEYLVETRAQAERVLDAIIEHLVSHDDVSVADIKTFMGVTPTYNDTLWGWKSAYGFSITPRKLEKKVMYELVIPEPERRR